MACALYREDYDRLPGSAAELGEGLVRAGHDVEFLDRFEEVRLDRLADGGLAVEYAAPGGERGSLRLSAGEAAFGDR
ncbi:MAG: hypothetical protein GF328_09930 [Candidatus Latescibacteria bacterium]|nr:hypothetical protein [Candidatus Latescibacterota bacterium]